jgi:hypothetical protein
MPQSKKSPSKIVIALLRMFFVHLPDSISLLNLNDGIEKCTWVLGGIFSGNTKRSYF